MRILSTSMNNIGPKTLFSSVSRQSSTSHYFWQCNTFTVHKCHYIGLHTVTRGYYCKESAADVLNEPRVINPRYQKVTIVNVTLTNVRFFGLSSIFLLISICGSIVYTTISTMGSLLRF